MERRMPTESTRPYYKIDDGVLEHLQDTVRNQLFKEKHTVYYYSY